jgi:hypothetical protein
MARHKGKDGSVVVGSTAVGEVKSFDVTITREVVTGEALGESWMGSDYGTGSWSGTLTCHMDPDDTNGQNALRTALIGGSTKVTLKLYVEGTAATDFELTGSALINEGGFSVTGNSEYTEATFSFTGDGAVTEGTVSG